MQIPENDLVQIRQAYAQLENPGLTAKLINYFGKPIELALAQLPDGFQERLQHATRRSIEKALDVAVTSLGSGKPSGTPSSDRAHKFFATASGAIGGAFGLAGLAVELPISTTTMLRSIADIGRSHGEDLRNPEARLSCLQVFALGGDSPSDDSSETGYYAVRAALSKSLSELAQILANRGAVQEGTPALARFVTAIASRFGVTVSEKVIVQAVPIVGAASGAAINVIFTKPLPGHGSRSLRCPAPGKSLRS
jgi:hypothetical protein